MYIKRINSGNSHDGTYYYKDPNHTILHRENGPAIEYANGDKKWCIDGKIHREDGPAVEWSNGDKSYYLNHKCVSKQRYIEYIRSKPICPAKKSRILKRCT